MKTPTTLIIMDGFGLSSSAAAGDNAIKAANTPNLDRIFAGNPCCRLSASGLDVGLPDGQMGNSEVGHTNIGGCPRSPRPSRTGTSLRTPPTRTPCWRRKTPERPSTSTA